MRRQWTWSMSVIAIAAAPAGAAAPADGQAVAAAFGALPAIQDAAVSPDGSRLVLVEPGQGTTTVATVVNVKTGDSKPVTYATGKPLRLIQCGWSAADRLICELYGIGVAQAQRLSWTRLVGVDADGRHMMDLGRAAGGQEALRLSQYNGQVIDWMSGEDGSVLMARDVVPEQQTGTLIDRSADGLDVERVDSRTNRSRVVEPANASAIGYVTDGGGSVRIMALEEKTGDGLLNGSVAYRYRLPNSHAWHDFSTVRVRGGGLRPVAVDGGANAAFALERKDGRDALYRVVLDGSMKADLVYADPKVDVDGVIEVGRRGRVIGYSYTTDQPNTVYFDPEYRGLAEKLSKALPNLPQIEFVSTSADEKAVLLLAASQTDPGRYYLLHRDTLSMELVSPRRPELKGMEFGPVRSLTYRAADGTAIPAYLTLPPGSDGKHLPALVMPHGGPELRDYGGFDWLAQFFAQRGYAVIQPEYRGSTGYGDAFFNSNGFRSWKTAIGDVNDAGRWLVAQGIADPAKLAIFGWSYGGYAALQANVLDPALFKAVVAVAPLTDFDMAAREHAGFTDYAEEVTRFGNGAYAAEGSPDRHADRFVAPVLMFHGDQDINVDIGESRAMDAALRRAGKQSRLVVYPGLDHQLVDSKARADMLAQSDAFLRTTLHIGG